VLKLEGVELRQGAFALSVSITLEARQKYAVIGPSGAGKSTLLSAIGGFLPLHRGRIWWKDQDITQTDPGGRPITMLFQDNNLFPHLTVLQNVGLGIRPDLRLTTEEKARALAALTRVGLVDQATKRPGSLSGGQQSRAALARVLVQSRPLLLLDEPFAALGPALRNEMLDLVQDLVAETEVTLIMVTHTPDDVRRIADQVVFVGDGVAASPEPAESFMDDPPPALRAYLGETFRT
jgi:thiamine transport system ATP-binding protein